MDKKIFVSFCEAILETLAEFPDGMPRSHIDLVLGPLGVSFSGCRQVESCLVDTGFVSRSNDQLKITSQGAAVVAESSRA